MKAGSSRTVSLHEDGSRPGKPGGGEVYVLRIDRAKIIREIVASLDKRPPRKRKN